MKQLVTFISEEHHSKLKKYCDDNGLMIRYKASKLMTFAIEQIPQDVEERKGDTK